MKIHRVNVLWQLRTKFFLQLYFPKDFLVLMKQFPRVKPSIVEQTIITNNIQYKTCKINHQSNGTESRVAYAYKGHTIQAVRELRLQVYLVVSPPTSPFVFLEAEQKGGEPRLRLVMTDLKRHSEAFVVSVVHEVEVGQKAENVHLHKVEDETCWSLWGDRSALGVQVEPYLAADRVSIRY